MDAIDKRSRQRVAVKRIRNVFRNQTDAKRVYREMYILRHLNNPHVIKLYDVVCPGIGLNDQSIHPPVPLSDQTIFPGFGLPRPNAIVDTSLDDIYLIFEFADTDLKK